MTEFLESGIARVVGAVAGIGLLLALLFARGRGSLLDEGAATEFAASVAAGYSIYSTLNSSPWTAESFGGDPAKAASCLEYSRLATYTNVALGLFTSLIAKSLWPMAGFAVVSAEMHYLYERAVRRARENGHQGWTA